LETIIEKIESGQVGLEDSLVGYEKGMQLIQRCASILSTAEQRIEELTADAQGQLQQAHSQAEPSAPPKNASPDQAAADATSDPGQPDEEPEEDDPNDVPF
jgi:exodeoxyribonuclease VII small subunit